MPVPEYDLDQEDIWEEEEFNLPTSHVWSGIPTARELGSPWIPISGSDESVAGGVGRVKGSVDFGGMVGYRQGGLGLGIM